MRNLINSNHHPAHRPHTAQLGRTMAQKARRRRSQVQYSRQSRRGTGGRCGAASLCRGAVLQRYVVSFLGRRSDWLRARRSGDYPLCLSRRGSFAGSFSFISSLNLSSNLRETVRRKMYADASRSRLCTRRASPDCLRQARFSHHARQYDV